MKYSGPHELPKGLTLLSIAQPDGAETLGIKTGSSVIDVRVASRLLGIPTPLTMEELLREGNAAALTQIAASVCDEIQPALLDEAGITYGRLFTNPGKIICVGINYRHHAEEIGVQPPRVPPLFSKFKNALAAHN